MLLTMIRVSIKSTRNANALFTTGVFNMYVCLCKGITDHQIRAEVQQGADTLRDISRRLGVATQCGKCAGCARQVIREAVVSHPEGRNGIPCRVPVAADLVSAI